jgi:hypothetical protein
LEEPSVSSFKTEKVGQVWKLVYNTGKGGWNKAISKRTGATDTEKGYLPEDGIKVMRERVRG